jgi:hypothetical protein
MFRSSIEISREICQVEDSGESIVKKRVRNASTNVPGPLDQRSGRRGNETSIVGEIR